MQTQEVRLYDSENTVVVFQGNDGASVTPSDSNTFEPGILYIGTGGTVVLKTAKGTQMTFVNYPSGEFLPVKSIMVYATGTTASDINVVY